jgi:NADH:ubiquinone oxidoreductase subunit 6 (subunit J)
MTRAAKSGLFVCFLFVVMMVALAAHEYHGHVMVGGPFFAFLALLVAVGILILDIVYRRTRSALRELRKPPE